MSKWSAIVLAGGRGSRLGDVEKADVILAGRSLLEHVLAGLDVPVVVVGPEREVVGEVRFVLEEPRFGGPVAGLRAAVALIETPIVAVFAVDLPRAAPVLHSLVAQFSDQMQALVPVRDGHDEYVCSVFRTDALRKALGECGDSMRSLFEALDVTRLEVTGKQARMLQDVDTAEDLERLELDPGN